MGIVVIGSTFIDMKGYPLGAFIPNGRNAGRVVEVHGGVGRNIAEDIANAGVATTFVSVVDGTGLSLGIVNRLAEHGVDTGHIRQAEGGLGMWLAVFDETGDVYASISRRSDLSGILQTLEESGDAIFSQADGICIEFDIHRPVLEKTLELAERYGKQVFAVITDMTFARERIDLLDRITCLVCNQQEAGMLFERDLDDASPDELLPVLIEELPGLGLRSMVVTMGGQGSVYVDASGANGWCPAQDADVVDTTGAGDAFFAGVSIGLTHGEGLAEACSIGTQLATLVIGTDENVCPVLELPL
ncbi:MAG: hypothetical protein IJH87_06330 [Atopobiaceae bacterium]|nr:hypothetical protein [Atopobiaceae bacterium]